MAKKVQKPGDIVRYVPAPEPLGAAFAIFLLTLVEIAFVVMFVWGLSSPESFVAEHASWRDMQTKVEIQQFLGVCLAAAILTLAAILSLYRKFFVPDVLILKERKPKYEDLM
ncbi:MAG TPA: hypothetical protein VNZ52_00395 [Candidatus Thermoplasmatota archaeon]|nr:hypothetical protein [Candidatus Thermoplasmatota archaeon]